MQRSMTFYALVITVQIVVVVIVLIPCGDTTSVYRGRGRNPGYFNRLEYDGPSKESRTNSTAYNRKSRFLNLFFVVRFANGLCNGTNGLSGTCYTAAQCTSLGGTASGTCARGYGACCVFILNTCGNSTNQNCSYFQNPGFPSTFGTAQTCSVFVNKIDSGICQYKLDLLTFDVGRPVSGACVGTDRFTVSGQNSNSPFPPLCGLNTGQSAFVQVSESQGPITLSMTTSGTFARSWRIKVTQIRCNSPALAPQGCLQYLTGATGAIKSFNYDVTTPAASVGYLNDLRYSICIRKEMGFCNVQFTNTADFAINTPVATIIAGEAGAGAAECTVDYLLVAGVRTCGFFLNAQIAAPDPTANAAVTDSTNGPIIAEFVSDATTNARGFNVNYQQTPCAGRRRRR